MTDNVDDSCFERTNAEATFREDEAGVDKEKADLPKRTHTPLKNAVKTEKRPTLSSTPSWSQPTSSSASRTLPGGVSTKPSSRPAMGSSIRKPVLGPPPTTTASPGTRSQAATRLKDENARKSAIDGPSQRLSTAGKMVGRSPAVKPASSMAETRSMMALTSSTNRKPPLSRTTTASPTKPTVRPLRTSPIKPHGIAPSGSLNPTAPQFKAKKFTATPEKSSTTAVESSVLTPQTSIRPSTAPSMSSTSSNEASSWQQTVKEMEVVNELLQESRARETLQERIKELEATIESLSEKIKLSDVRDAVKTNRGSLSEQDKEYVLPEERVEAYKSQISKLVTELKSRQDRILDLKEMLEEESARAVTSIEIMRAEHGVEIVELIHRHDTDMAEVHTRLEERTAKSEALVVQQRAQIESTKSMLAARIDSEEASKRKMSDMQSDLHIARLALEEANATIKEHLMCHNEELRDRDVELKGLSQVVQDLQDEVQTVHETKERELDAKLIKLSEDHTKAMRSMQFEHEAALALLIEEHAAALKKGSSEFEELEAGMEVETRAMEEKHRASTNILEKQLVHALTAKDALAQSLDWEEAEKAAHARALAAERLKGATLERKLLQENSQLHQMLTAQKKASEMQLVHALAAKDDLVGSLIQEKDAQEVALEKKQLDIKILEDLNRQREEQLENATVAQGEITKALDIFKVDIKAWEARADETWEVDESATECASEDSETAFLKAANVIEDLKARMRRIFEVWRAKDEQYASTLVKMQEDLDTAVTPFESKHRDNTEIDESEATLLRKEISELKVQLHDTQFDMKNKLMCQSMEHDVLLDQHERLKAQVRDMEQELENYRGGSGKNTPAGWESQSGKGSPKKKRRMNCKARMTEGSGDAEEYVFMDPAIKGAANGANAPRCNHSFNCDLARHVVDLQKEAADAKVKSRIAEEQLQITYESSEARGTRFMEIEAELKVTKAELTEMRTKRADGVDFIPDPRTPLRRSRVTITRQDSEDQDRGSPLSGIVSPPPFSSPKRSPLRT
ncbi:MAG: hypothetical protein M1827_007642 [Pycnora praestabilis]|nr:MAG: hypothetical protein M1827_007642 [Pycnora praestabilis]